MRHLMQRTIQRFKGVPVPVLLPRGRSPFRLGTVPLLRPLLLLFLFLPLWPAGDADAQFNGALRGEYDVTLVRDCNLGTNLTIKGVLHFNGDGTGTFAGNQAFFTNIAGPSPPLGSEADVSCAVSYTVNSDGSFSLQLNTCGVNFTAGNILNPPQTAAGQQATVDQIPAGGRVTLDGTVLQLSDADLAIETVTFTTAPNIGTTVQRSCNGGGVATSRR